MKIDIRGEEIKNPCAKLNGFSPRGGGIIVLSTLARHKNTPENGGYAKNTPKETGP